jgi:4-carboxymuconolactone decarboxylase
MTEERAARLTPLSREECGDDVRATLAHAYSDEVANRFLSDGPDAMPMPNVLGTLMRHPALIGPFLTYNNALLKTPTLDGRLRELMVLRVAWRARSRYEWVQHVRLAPRVAITSDEIDALRADIDPAAWTSLEADALLATDQLIDRYRIDDETWQRLAGQLDERQLIELVFVVGTYTGLAMAFNSLGLEIDADLRDVASASLWEFEE